MRTPLARGAQKKCGTGKSPVTRSDVKKGPDGPVVARVRPGRTAGSYPSGTIPPARGRVNTDHLQPACWRGSAGRVRCRRHAATVYQTFHWNSRSARPWGTRPRESKDCKTEWPTPRAAAGFSGRGKRDICRDGVTKCEHPWPLLPPACRTARLQGTADSPHAPLRCACNAPATGRGGRGPKRATRRAFWPSRRCRQQGGHLARRPGAPPHPWVARHPSASVPAVHRCFSMSTSQSSYRYSCAFSSTRG